LVLSASSELQRSKTAKAAKRAKNAKKAHFLTER
jgi:hypothetical protein